MPSKATLIEASEYLRLEARKEEKLAEQLNKVGEGDKARSVQSRARTLNRWADHILEAAKQQ